MLRYLPVVMLYVLQSHRLSAITFIDTCFLNFIIRHLVKLCYCIVIAVSSCVRLSAIVWLSCFVKSIIAVSL